MGKKRDDLIDMIESSEKQVKDIPNIEPQDVVLAYNAVGELARLYAVAHITHSPVDLTSPLNTIYGIIEKYR